MVAMHSTDDNQGPVVVVLAAGQGRRFRASGGRTGKLQALLHGRSVLEHTLAAVEASGLRAVLVENGPLWRSAGMGHSIARGVALSPEASGWLILPGDLPAISPQTLRAVAGVLQTHGGVVRPQIQGRWGHPVGFSCACRQPLLRLTGDSGAQSVVKDALSRGQLHTLALEDWGALVDTDTLADLSGVAKCWEHRRMV